MCVPTHVSFEKFSLCGSWYSLYPGCPQIHSDPLTQPPEFRCELGFLLCLFLRGRVEVQDYAM